MPSRTFLERAAHPTKVPGVLVSVESLWEILGTKDPRVIRQPATRIRSPICIDELPRRWNADGKIVEHEGFGVPDEVKEMRVTATELLRAVHAKCVVPDYPTATSKAQFLLENQLQ